MKFTVEHNGQTVEAEAIKIQDKIWIRYLDPESGTSPNGVKRVLAVSSQDDKKKKRAGSSGGAGGNQVAAPMPGKVTKIQKNIGDKVEIGDVVLVMEAMKMEYTLKAEVAGEIKSVNCVEGEQVVLGKILAEIKI